MLFSNKKNLLIVGLSFALLLLLFAYAIFRDNAHITNPNLLYNVVANEEVVEIYYDEKYLFFMYKHKKYKILKNTVNLLLLRNASIIEKPPFAFYFSYLIIFLFIIVVYWLKLWKYLWLNKRIKYKNLNTIRSQQDKPIIKVLPVQAIKSNVKLSDVGGIKEVKVELEEIIDFLKNPKKYHQFGLHLPRGVLLIGPPGVGKTLIAKAVAGEAEVPFFYQSGASFVQIYVGMGAKRVQELFAKAKRETPSIIFIDEIDSVGKKRGGQSNDERDSTLNQLLTEMDGFEGSSGVIVIGATNKIDVLDSALLRAGRFDRRIFLELPSLEERIIILEKYLKKIKHNVNIKELAKMSIGFNGASLSALVNEAGLYALKKNQNIVLTEHFFQIRDKVQFGKKRSLSLGEDEKKIQAYYQSAKAIVAFFYNLSFEKFTLLSGGLKLPNKEILSRSSMLNILKVHLAGMAILDLKYKEWHTNIKDDLEKSKALAKKMVYEYSMGNTFLPNEEDVETLLNEMYKEVKYFIKDKEENIQNLSTILLEKEQIHYDDIKKECDDFL